jgi:hypothetical protein
MPRELAFLIALTFALSCELAIAGYYVDPGPASTTDEIEGEEGRGAENVLGYRPEPSPSPRPKKKKGSDQAPAPGRPVSD